MESPLNLPELQDPASSGLSDQMNNRDMCLRSLLGNSPSGLKIEILLVATASMIVILHNTSDLPNLVLISLGG